LDSNGRTKKVVGPEIPAPNPAKSLLLAVLRATGDGGTVSR
jgi:hypothetical protein